MQTITLSANAVAVLRFESKGWRAKSKESRLPAYRELAAAGIMQPVGPDRIPTTDPRKKAWSIGKLFLRARRIELNASGLWPLLGVDGMRLSRMDPF